MRFVVIAGVVLALGFGAQSWASDEPGTAEERSLEELTAEPKAPPPPEEITVKVKAPEGTSEQDIAAAIAAENARREPAAQRATQVAKQKADADAARAARVGKICDSIPEKAMRDDPSLRKMCQ